MHPFIVPSYDDVVALFVQLGYHKTIVSKCGVHHPAQVQKAILGKRNISILVKILKVIREQLCDCIDITTCIWRERCLPRFRNLHFGIHNLLLSTGSPQLHNENIPTGKDFMCAQRIAYRRRVGLDSSPKRKISKSDPTQFGGANPAVRVHAVLGCYDNLGLMLSILI
jgi:hypothetical protein